MLPQPHLLPIGTALPPDLAQRTKLGKSCRLLLKFGRTFLVRRNALRCLLFNLTSG